MIENLADNLQIKKRKQQNAASVKKFVVSSDFGIHHLAIGYL